MKTFTKKLISTLLVFTMILTWVPIASVMAVVQIVPISQMDPDQRVSFNYSISDNEVGESELRQVSVEVKVENTEVHMLSFRLGWDNNVVTPSIADGLGINEATTDGVECLIDPADIIDSEGHKIRDYIDVDIPNMDTVNHFLYYMMSMNENIMYDTTNYPLLDSDTNLTTDGGISFAKITFQLCEGKTVKDINENTFSLKTSFETVPTGFKMIWFDGTTENQILDQDFAEFISRIPPIIELSQSPLTGTWTLGPVQITAELTGIGNDLALVKYMKGTKTIEDFLSAMDEEADELLKAEVKDLVGFEGGRIETPTFGVSENGIYTVYTIDYVGNETVETIEITNIDLIPPTITSVTGNAESWTNQNVTLTVNGASDNIGSGLHATPYSFDGGANWQSSNEKEYNTNTNGIAIWVRDALGNTYKHTSIDITYIDKVEPIVENIEIILPEEDGHYKEGELIEIEVTISKEVNGETIPDLIIKFGTGENITLSNGELDEDEVTIIYTYEIQDGDNGLLTIVEMSGGDLEDRAKNEIDFSVLPSLEEKITADTLAPTITSVTGNPTKWVNTNVTLTVNGASDNGGAGLHANPYSFDGGTTWQSGNTKEYTENTSGIVIWVRDALENTYKHTSIDITYIDKVRPTVDSIEIKSPADGFYAESEKITIEVTLDKEIEDGDITPNLLIKFGTGSNITLNNGVLEEDNVTITYTYTIINGDNGLLTIVEMNGGDLEDRATNRIDFTLLPALDEEIKADTKAPTITDVTGNAVAPTNQNVTLTVNGATDNGGSGLHATAYSFDNGVTWQANDYKVFESNQTVNIKVRDALGNTYTHTAINITYIDKVDPTVKSIEVTSPLDGHYKEGEVITMVVTLDKEIVDFNNAPTLTIAFGEGENIELDDEDYILIDGYTITYTYEIQDGDNGLLIIVDLDGGDLEDIAGNEIDFTVLPKLEEEIIADTIAPTVATGPSLSPSTPTNGNVTVTIVFNEEVKDISGWSTVDNITFTKTYTNNTASAETVNFEDLAGNTNSVQVSVTNIDRVNPVVTEIEITDPETTGNYKAGTEVEIVVSLSKPVDGDYVPDLIIAIGEEIVADSEDNLRTVEGILASDGLSIIYTYTIKNGDNGLIEIVGLDENGDLEDSATNELDLDISLITLTGASITTDTEAPTLVSNTPSPSTPTNGNVTVTIVFNEEVKNISGWSTVDNITFTKTYTDNTLSAETINFEDLAGNAGTQFNVSVTNIDRVNPVVTGIEITDPETNGNYKAGTEVEIVVSLSKPVDGDYVPDLIISIGEEVEEDSEDNLRIVEGILASDGLSIIYTYIIQSGDNGLIEIVGLDENGDLEDSATNELDIDISLITLTGASITTDTEPPTVISSTPSPNVTTNGNVTVTIVFSEEVKDNISGWTKVDEVTYTKTYNNNTSSPETVNFEDLAGNTNSTTVSVTNIDRAEPVVTGIEITDPETNGNYKAGTEVEIVVTLSKSVDGDYVPDLIIAIGEEIVADSEDNLRTVEGILASDGLSITYTYTIKNGDNGLIEIVGLDENGDLEDIAGNELDIDIETILVTGTSVTADTKAPTLVSGPSLSPSTPTNGNVTVTIVFSEKVQNISGWSTIDNITFTKTYTNNTASAETVNFTDLAGNAGTSFNVNVANIDRVQPEVESIEITSPADGYYKEGEIITIVVTLDKEIADGEIPPTLTIAFGEGENIELDDDNYIIVDGYTITYTYEIQGGDNGKLIIVDLYGGDLTDEAGNEIDFTVLPELEEEITADTEAPDIELSQDPEEETRGSVEITVVITKEGEDSSKIIETRWIKVDELLELETLGDILEYYDEEFFAQGGGTLLDVTFEEDGDYEGSYVGTFNVSTNGTYVVYTIDQVGNVTIETIEINNIDDSAYGYLEGSVYATEYAAAREEDKLHKATIYVFKEGKIDWESASNYRETGWNFADLKGATEDLILYDAQTDPETGEFIIEAKEGTYDILIDKAGYLDYIIKGVVVTGENDEQNPVKLGQKRLDAGDINKDGKVDVVDIGWIKDAITGNYAVPINIENAFDQNEDGVLSMLDVSIVKKYAAMIGLERIKEQWVTPEP